MIARKRHCLHFCLLLGMVALAASCARGPENYYFGNYSEAERLYQKGEYERAIQKFTAYRDENPEGNLAVISLYYIAKSHAALGHWDEAKELYQKVMAEQPDGVWANFSQTQLKEADLKAQAEKANEEKSS